MKKVLGIISVALMVVLLSGCGLTNNQNAKPAKGNCNVFECIKKLDTKDDLEKVNKVMGFEGELVTDSSSYKSYQWVINEEKNETVKVVFYTTSATISITFSDEDVKNSKVDFSKYNDIKKAMNNKESKTYDDIKKAFNADGILIEKTSYNEKYRWVDKDGKYMNATFSNTSGACTIMIGRI